MANIEILYQRRRATFVLPFNNPAQNIKKDMEYRCRVHGCFQVNDGDGANPYFVVELENGKCLYVAPEYITFIKEDDEC